MKYDEFLVICSERNVNIADGFLTFKGICVGTIYVTKKKNRSIFSRWYVGSPTILNKIDKEFFKNWLDSKIVSIKESEIKNRKQNLECDFI